MYRLSKLTSCPSSGGIPPFSGSSPPRLNSLRPESWANSGGIRPFNPTLISLNVSTRLEAAPTLTPGQVKMGMDGLHPRPLSESTSLAPSNTAQSLTNPGFSSGSRMTTPLEHCSTDDGSGDAGVGEAVAVGSGVAVVVGIAGEVAVGVAGGASGAGVAVAVDV